MIISTHRIYDWSEITQEFLDSLVIDNPAYWSKSRNGYPTEGIPQEIRLYKERDGKIYVPRNIPIYPQKAVKIVDKRVDGKEIKLESKIVLRDDQVPAVAALAEANDGILNAGCGKGKSVMALEAISRVGRPALILVHKEFLMTQWANHIKNWFGVEPGYVQGGVFKWEGYPIVVGMLQTIYARRDNLPAGFRENFGIIISDEVHRVSAPTWSSVIEMFPAKRRWGLSATLNRSDGLEIIFKSHIGDVIYQLLGTNLQPKVYAIKTGIEVYQGAFDMRNGKLNTAKLTTYLTTIPERNKKILGYLVSAARSGRKILVLSERVEHVKYLKQAFDHNTKEEGFETRMYIGGMEAENRTEAEENADILFATTQMAKEALDIPALDTLFLVTPQGSEITTEQAVGRIARSFEGKKTPMVVDFIDEFLPYCKALWGKRVKVYRKMELQIGG